MHTQTKQIAFLRKALFALFLSSVLLVPGVVEGKSVSWNYADNSGAYYYKFGWYGYQNYGIPAGTGSTGYVKALENPNYTVLYGANVYNQSAGGQLLSDGASIPVGTSLRFEPKSFDTSDISWFGTGFSGDSPNGEWMNNAAPSHDSPDDMGGDSGSACRAQDYVGAVAANTGGNWNVHIPLSINPPSVSVNHAGTASMSCDASQRNCTVTGAGTINSSFTFAPTYGKLYYRYMNTVQYLAQNPLADLNNCNQLETIITGDPSDPQPCNFYIQGCFGDNSPLRKNCSTWDCANASDYQLPVPQQTIPFTFTVLSNNNPPTSPTLTCPGTGVVSTNYSFTTQGTDPDNDTIKYGMDWDNNGSVDEWMPVSGFVASGTAQNFTHQWASVGTYTIKALAQDNQGGTSAWSTPCTTTVSNTVNGVCGAASGFPATNPPTIGLCFPGTNTAVTPGVAPGPYSWTCTGSGGGSNAACSAPYLSPAPNFNFQINGVVANNSLTVARNANLNIIWNNVTNATSCSGTGNSWGGAKAITGGSDNISATAASLYQLSCTGPGGTVAKTISVTIQPTLKICQNSCSSNIEPPSAFSMNVGDTKNLVACFNDAASCTNATGDVTTSATWTEGGNSTVSLSGTNPKTLTATNSGTESIQATYSGNTVTRSVTVTCTDSGACQRDSRSQSLCQKDTFNVTDNCGQVQNCTGEKTCDYNWKEVAP